MSGVTITTYTMIAFSGKRSEESARVMDQIRSREWGLLLMDEVHVVPAQMFRKVCLHCMAPNPAFITNRGPLMSTYALFKPTCYSFLAIIAVPTATRPVDTTRPQDKSIKRSNHKTALSDFQCGWDAEQHCEAGACVLPKTTLTSISSFC